jgi:pyruvate formate lyase activating enzyme
MKEADLFQKLEGEKVKCLACQHYCKILKGKLGFCKTRINKNGKLYSLIYGVLNGAQIDPIEKKPLYHFYPGTRVFSLGSFGCNFRCKQCLNYWCSWGDIASKTLAELKEKADAADVVLPEEVVKQALLNKCQGIAFTYNEPSIWPEYVKDVASLAKKKGLYTVFVTNGFWTRQALEYYGEFIDACNIDIKGFSKKTYKKMGAFFNNILEITKLALKKYKIFTELTTLIIPGINDSQKELKSLAFWIKSKLGPDIPWHLSRFDPELSPDKEFKKLPATSIKTLKTVYNIGKEAGLNNVYVWAPPKDSGEKLFAVSNTYCPNCQALVLKRTAWEPELFDIKIKKGKVVCKQCGSRLNIKI